MSAARLPLADDEPTLAITTGSPSSRLLSLYFWLLPAIQLQSRGRDALSAPAAGRALGTGPRACPPARSSSEASLSTARGSVRDDAGGGCVVAVGEPGVREVVRC